MYVTILYKLIYVFVGEYPGKGRRTYCAAGTLRGRGKQESKGG